MLTVSNKQLLFVQVRIQQLVKCRQKNVYSSSISSIFTIIRNMMPVSKETSMMQQLQLLVYNCASAHICYFIMTLKLPPATHSAESSAGAAAAAELVALQKHAQQHNTKGSICNRQVPMSRGLQNKIRAITPQILTYGIDTTVHTGGGKSEGFST